MTPSAGILTFILHSFLTVFSGGFGAVLPDAKRLLFLMAGIELTLAALFWALKGENLIVPLIQKTLMIGTFAYFVLNWPSLIHYVLRGFIHTGQIAGAGGGGGPILNLTDPSGIISLGLNAINPIATTIKALSWTKIGDIIVLGWAMIFTLLAFAIIGIQCFIAYLEFYLVAVLSLILVPFGVFKHTAFLAEKSLGAIISHGVKLMVLAFIISAATPVLTSLATVLPGAGVTFDQALSLMIGSMAIAFLAWHAPGIAGGMMSGGPSLNAGTAASTAVAAGIGAALGYAGARGIASEGAKATIAGSQALGAVVGAGKQGAAIAASDGAGPVGKSVGAARGVATAAKRFAAHPWAKAWEDGKVRGATAAQARQVNRDPPTPPTAKDNNAMTMIRMAQRAVPHTASAGSGISAPLHGAHES